MILWLTLTCALCNFWRYLGFFAGGAKSKMPPTLNSIEKSQQNHLQHKIRLARTISREPEVKESSVDDDDEDGDGQVSAV